VAILIVVTVGFVQEYRSEKTLEKMGTLLPPKCQCLRDGQVNTIFAKYLVPGDIVKLTTGDRIPADMRLVEVADLSVDESSFTGECEAKYKSEKLLAGVKLDVSNMNNICFQGTLVVTGNGTGVVICTGDKSQFGELFRMMQSEEPPRTPLQKSMDTLGKQLSIGSLLIIGVIMAVGCLQGRPVLDMFNVGVRGAIHHFSRIIRNLGFLMRFLID
jgi:Ca2+-transporting ATPase